MNAAPAMFTAPPLFTFIVPTCRYRCRPRVEPVPVLAILEFAPVTLSVPRVSTLSATLTPRPVVLIWPPPVTLTKLVPPGSGSPVAVMPPKPKLTTGALTTAPAPLTLRAEVVFAARPSSMLVPALTTPPAFTFIVPTAPSLLEI